jgi:hypothetical protein
MSAYNDGSRDHDGGDGLTAIMAETLADVRLPDGLLDRAVARNRRRTTRNRVIGAVGTVAAAAIAVAVAVNLAAAPATSVPGTALPSKTLPGTASAQPAGQQTVETDAYVLARATAASIDSRKLISVTNSVGIMYTDIATQQQRYVASLRAKNGQPYFEWADLIKHGTWNETMVVNADRVYSIQSAPADGVQIAPFLPLQDSSDPMAAFYIALKKHQIKVVGHRTLHGEDTILLRIVRDTAPCKQLPGYSKSAPAIKCVNGKAVFTKPVPDDEVWIDARTYLVVQTKTYKVYFKPLTSGKDQPFWKSWITTVNWLQPTNANLALLSITPPAGYTQVPATDMVKYLGPIS